MPEGVGHQLRPVLEPELVEQSADVGLDGFFADEEALGNLPVGFSEGDLAQDFELAGRDRVGSASARGRSGEDATGYGRIDEGSPQGRGSDGREQHFGVGVFSDISDGAGAQDPDQPGFIYGSSECDDANLGMGIVKAAGGLNAVESSGHQQIQYDDLR